MIPSKASPQEAESLLGLLWIFIVSVAKLGLSSCSKKESAPNPEQAKPSSSAAPTNSSDQVPLSANSVKFGPAFALRTGDLDEMARQRNIRAIVMLNPIGFFYSGGHPMGANYEALREFETFVNKKLNTGKLKVQVTFNPIGEQCSFL